MSIVSTRFAYKDKGKGKITEIRLTRLTSTPSALLVVGLRHVNPNRRFVLHGMAVTMGRQQAMRVAEAGQPPLLPL